jgi:HEAT repeat protein
MNMWLKADPTGCVVPLLLAAVLSTGSSVAAGDSSSRYVTGEGQLAISLVPDKLSIMLGEPVWLSFKVENLTDQNLQVIVGGDYQNALGRPNSFKVETADKDGNAVPQPDAGMEGGGMVGPQPLLAKSNYVFRLFLPDWAQFVKPGTYLINCRKTLELLRPQSGVPFHEQVTTKLETEEKASITVTAMDDQRIGGIIADLGARSLSDDGGARKSLASIHDNRIIPFLLRILALKTYEAKFFALETLADYDTSASVDALKSGLDIRGDDLPNCCTTPEGAEQLATNLRVVAAQSLAKNRNPESRRFLLSRRGDPMDELRLTVVHMLGRSKSDESISILREMTHDTNTMVRGEAERYLKLFGDSVDR